MATHKEGGPVATHEGGAPAEGGRLVTIPNALSVARLAGVPLFLWLVLVPKADGWAVALLALAGLSDWLDGKIARAWHQQSRFGEILDPAADRLYIAAILIGLAVREIIPWWLLGLLVARELLLGVTLLVLRRYGYGPPQVNLTGKAATLCLLYAFPLLFLGDHPGGISTAARVVGWAFAIWGTALYWWAATLYLVQARRLVRGVKAAGALAPRAGTGEESRPR